MAVDTSYYDVLGVSPTANDSEIKKAYRRMAMKHHPDKNPGDETAKQRFQEVGEAYQVLSDPELRKRYDQFGKDSAVPSAGFEDPVEFATNIFGGEAFQPWIGELSLLREMQRLGELSEEKHNEDAQAEATANSGSSSGPGPSPKSPGPAMITHPDYDQKPLGDPGQIAHDHHHHLLPHHSANEEKRKRQLAKQKRREELEKIDRENREAREKRVQDLTKSLIEKLSVWTEAPKNDDVTRSFLRKMELEANELKMESFGQHLLHVIGTIYYQRAQNFLKSQKLFGLGSFFGRMKETGGIIRDGWNTVSTALDAQSYLNEAAKLEGDETVTPEVQAAVEQAILGKVLNAMWMGSRMEVQSVLREVCDRVIHDKSVPLSKRLERAQALLMVGRVFRTTQRTPEESEEMQFFEQIVAEASQKKNRKKRKEAQAQAQAYAAQVHAQNQARAQAQGGM